MVPYVRISFWKHFKDGLKYIEGADTAWFEEEGTMSIEDPEYKEYPKAYQYAMDMTEREVYQGVEGLYHNLK